MASVPSLLPPPARSRVRAAAGCTLALKSSGHAEGACRPVLYFPRLALRAASNPALDVAAAAAAALKAPLHVVAVVDCTAPPRAPLVHGKLPARRHKFHLEGAAEMQASIQAAVNAACTEAGTAAEMASVRASLRVESPSDRAAVHLTLASRAALVVCDEHFNTWPDQRFHAQLAAACRNANVPLAVVDASCVVPAARIPPGKTHRAYVFEEASKPLRSAVLAIAAERGPEHAWGTLPADIAALARRTDASSWSEDNTASWRHDVSELSTEERARWVDQRCAEAAPALDGDAPPVTHTVGGASRARARWRAFVDGGGLGRYASTRNDPNAPSGIGGAGAWRGASRMSAYTNMGMADPMAMAAEATAKKSAKFLSEFLTWRELSHAFLYHHAGGDPSMAPTPESLRARPHEPTFAASKLIPSWARAALSTGDVGVASSAIPADGAGAEQQVTAVPLPLAKGESSDAFWDTCQKHLVATGELHNNLRMTWGKRIVAWAQAPPAWGAAHRRCHRSAAEAAVAWLSALNDTYALDGGSPPSYGGLLWCVGLFDSPKGSGAGALRQRPTSWASKRVDLVAFKARAASMEASVAPVAQLFKRQRVS